MTSLKGAPFWEPLELKWEQAGKSDSSKKVLRWAVLRETSRALHAEKSRLLATSKTIGKYSGLPLSAIQKRLQNISWDDLEKPTLDLLLRSPTPEQIIGSPESAVSQLPKEFFKGVSKSKLERFDRKWEAWLTVVMVKSQWSFYSLEVIVNLSDAENFHRRLDRELWPKAIILFVEGNEKYEGKIDPKDQLWPGRWIIGADHDFDQRDLKFLSQYKEFHWKTLLGI